MSTTDLKLLFAPGDGNVPPYLAGRKAEQAYFRDCVDILKNRKPTRQNLILYGPRGNGKTALLRYLQQETRRQEASNLSVLWATPRTLEDPGKLVDLIVGDHAALRRKIQSAEFSINVGIVKANAQVDLSRRTLTLGDLLEERCQHQPLILIIDEAHRLSPQLGEDLLNASQTVRNAGSPFLLVLAGTPNLKATLRQANASFWDRSEIVPLGRLSPDEASQALAVPLQAAGIIFAPGVIEYIVEQTHCYPFFIQVWGDSLARRLDQTGETTVTRQHARDIEGEVTGKRREMYDTRRDEIEEAGLLSVAESTANAFIRGGEAPLHERGLKEAIARGMPGDEPITEPGIREKLKQLSHLGYVWRIHAPGGYVYEPGIPSLMSFIQEYSLSQTRGKAAEPDQQKRENEHH